MTRLLLICAIVCTTIATSCSDKVGEKDITSTEQSIGDRNDVTTEASASTDRTSLPRFALQDVTGRNVSLESFKGKKVFVNLWASWCPPCLREMPSIEKLQTGVDSNKVAFVMISLDDDFDKAKQFLIQEKLTLPIYYPAESLPTLFNVQGIPTTFIFDEAGVLFHRVDGGDDYNSEKYFKLLK
jgi:thiol-disulfide isomerase/thioredoxin